MSTSPMNPYVVHRSRESSHTYVKILHKDNHNCKPYWQIKICTLDEGLFRMFLHVGDLVIKHDHQQQF